MRIIAHSRLANRIDKVFIDGVESKLVVEMDPEEGWARRYKTDENGKVIVKPNGEAKMEMVTGEITYTLRKKNG